MDAHAHMLRRPLPEELEPLGELTFDLRWTWSHASDTLWKAMDPEAWELTHNPWLILQSVSQARLVQLAADPQFTAELQRLVREHREHVQQPGWFKQHYPDQPLNPIAYFSMEFGLGEALPLYAGGLGILAGDHLKTACDLDVPLVGVGLLYQEGYFRQLLDDHGWQVEGYPYNDPSSLPICPVMTTAGEWLWVPLELPGRTLRLRIWQVQVGRVMLYLLDSNDPLNSPVDRGITGKLYDASGEIRLLQEMVLGEEWHTAEAMCRLNDALHDDGLRDQVVLFWNANNTYAFHRINWPRLRFSTTITTVSRYMKHLMWPMGLNPLAIPNGIPRHLLGQIDDSTTSALRRALAAEVVLFKMARWDPDKNWDGALKAIGGLKERGLKTVLVARGGIEPYGQEVVREAHTLGLRVKETSFDAWPRRDYLAALRYAVPADVLVVRSPIPLELSRLLYRTADAVLANSRHEPFGLVGLEAMAAGGVAVTGATGED